MIINILHILGKYMTVFILGPFGEGPFLETSATLGGLGFGLEFGSKV